MEHKRNIQSRLSMPRPRIAYAGVLKISLSFIVPTESEFAGSWHVKWSSGSKSVYSIQRMGSVIRMRVLSCDWSASCATNKEADVRPSQSMVYSHKHGWAEVNNIHDGVLTIYNRLEDYRLKIVWYRPETGFSESGIGMKVKILRRRNKMLCRLGPIQKSLPTSYFLPPIRITIHQSLVGLSLRSCFSSYHCRYELKSWQSVLIDDEYHLIPV